MTIKLRIINNKNMCDRTGALRIGRVLTRLMKDNGLSYGVLSRELNIPKTTLFNYAQGCLPRSEVHIRKLCLKFDITIEELFFDKKPVSEQLLKKGQVIKGTFMIVEVEKHE